MRQYAKIWLVVFCLIIGWKGVVSAQQRSAVTQDGQEVILYPDGRWAYQRPPSNVQKKPLSAKKLLIGKNGIYGLSVDESKWAIQKKPFNEDHEFGLKHSDGDIYGFTILERIEFPINSLRDLILENAQDGGFEKMRVAEEETRLVNGKKVTYLITEGLYRGVPMVFSYYLYSGSAGTIQAGVYTARNLFQQYRTDILDLLNGLEVYK